MIMYRNSDFGLEKFVCKIEFIEIKFYFSEEK